MITFHIRVYLHEAPCRSATKEENVWRDFEVKRESFHSVRMCLTSGLMSIKSNYQKGFIVSSRLTTVHLNCVDRSFKINVLLETCVSLKVISPELTTRAFNCFFRDFVIFDKNIGFDQLSIHLFIIFSLLDRHVKSSIDKAWRLYEGVTKYRIWITFIKRNLLMIFPQWTQESSESFLIIRLHLAAKSKL